MLNVYLEFDYCTARDENLAADIADVL